MNLFELFVKIGVDDQASGNLSKLSSNLGKGLATAAKIGTGAVATAASGITALTSAAVNNYAEYEQLVGGAQLMFGEAYDTVAKNAQDAYKTVQMSQNEYLQQVNGFATGLKTALGGNEQAAAELANRIITAEADIIAATGNTAENVQNAFNGIMKSNFTMLDNLQIGITPTKEGFQDVIDKVNEWNKANGEATNYQMGNLADMQSALVDYIEMQGYAGYASREAANTISGSVASMKSALANLVTGIADENADLNRLIENFVESISVAAGNVAPRVEIALDGVLKLINGLMPKIANAIPTAVTKYAPKLVSSGVNILKSLVTGIKKNAKTIVTAAKDIVLNLTDGLVDLLPDVIDAGVELLSGIVSAIPEVVAKLATSVPQIVKAIADGLGAGVIEIGKAVVELFAPIVDESEIATNALKNQLSTLESFNSLVDGFSRQTTDLSKALSGNGKTISEIDDEISKAEDGITQILKKAFETQESLRQQDIKNIEAYNQKIREKNEEKLSIYRDQQLSEYRKLLLEIPTADVEDLAKYVGQAEAAFEAANKVVDEIYSDRILQIENFHKAQGTIGSEAYKAEMEEARKHNEEMLAINQEYYNKTLSAAAGAAGGLVSLDMSAFKKVAKQAASINEYFNKPGMEYWMWQNEAIYEALGTFDEAVSIYSNALKEIDTATANAFLSMQATAVSSGEQIDEATKETIETILSAYASVPYEFEDVGKSALLALIDGLEDKIPTLKNAADMTADEIIAELRKNLLSQKTNTVVDQFANKIQTYFGKKKFTFSFGVNYRANSSISAIDGSHKTGLDYVPYDGYIAELHRGERVLTAKEAKGSTGNTFNITVNGSKYQNEDTLAEAIANKIQQMTERRGAIYA